MRSIHADCMKYGASDGFTNYIQGAKIVGFVKVANAMVQQGVV